MNEKREKILAAVKKLGKSSPLQISDSTGIESSLCGYHLRAMAKDGTLKAAGTTSSRTYELAGNTPPQGRKEVKDAKRARPAAAEASFLPAVDVDRNLVLINAGAVTRFDDSQTAAIATLLSQHYD